MCQGDNPNPLTHPLDTDIITTKPTLLAPTFLPTTNHHTLALLPSQPYYHTRCKSKGLVCLPCGASQRGKRRKPKQVDGALAVVHGRFHDCQDGASTGGGEGVRAEKDSREKDTGLPPNVTSVIAGSVMQNVPTQNTGQQLRAHAGLMFLVRNWIATGFRRRSIALISKAMAVGTRYGMSLDCLLGIAEPGDRVSSDGNEAEGAKLGGSGGAGACVLAPSSRGRVARRPRPASATASWQRRPPPRRWRRWSSDADA